MSLTVFEQTYACSLADMPKWHRGRMRYGAWVINLHDAALEQQRQQAQQHLAPWLHPAGVRLGHISVFVCGFLSTERSYNDDFTYTQLAAQAAALQALEMPCFELRIGALNSFSTTAFFEVHDDGRHLDTLRRTLAAHAKEVRQSPYLPHLTVGLYREAVKFQPLQQSLRAFNCAPQTIEISSLEFVSFAAQEPQGELRQELCVNFR